MKRDDWNDLSAFMVVADERSFTRAAAQLDMSTSALSHAMKALECRLGFRLLTRTTRSVAPTEAGERLLRTLRPAFEQMRSELSALGELRGTPAGLVRLTACKHSATAVVWPILPGFLQSHPQIRVEVAIVDNVSDIDAAQYDAGIQLGERVAKDMIAVRVGPVLKSVVVGSPEYFATHPIPTRPIDLATQNCINYRLAASGGICSWEFVDSEERSFKVKVNGSLILNNLELLLKATLAGVGISQIFDDIVADHVAGGRLIRVLDEWCPSFPGYYLYHPSRRQTPPALVALIEALRARAAGRKSYRPRLANQLG